MTELMQLRVWLPDTSPEIWRRLLVDPRLTLEQLHTVLQHSFGWTNSHLHQFHEKDGTRYAVPSPMDDDFDFVASTMGGPIGRDRRAPTVHDERKVLLGEVFDRRDKILVYEYDFGDSWIHAVQFEKMVDPGREEFPPGVIVAKERRGVTGEYRAATCLEGERRGPPEDCGGVYGYQELLELAERGATPGGEDEAYELETLEWFGDWDPAQMSLSGINRLLARVRVRKAHVGAEFPVAEIVTRRRVAKKRVPRSR